MGVTGQGRKREDRKGEGKGRGELRKMHHAIKTIKIKKHYNEELGYFSYNFVYMQRKPKSLSPNHSWKMLTAANSIYL